MDVRKYFDSIPHERLLELLARLFKDAGVLRLFENIVGSYETRPGHGLPIGSLTSQYFANHFLTGLNRYARETLEAPGYVRCMDDFALWHPDKEFLKDARNRITAWLADERGLTVKPEPRINRADRGMDFLGLRVFPHTVRLNHRRKIRFLRRLRGLHAAGRYTGLPARRAFSQRKQSGRRPNGSNRVICGGSWNNNANNARCANRNNNWPNNASNNNGFRMARVQPDPRMPQARG